MSTFTEVTERVHPDYEVQVVDRVSHALRIAGRPSWQTLAEEMSAQSGNRYTEATLVNIFSRRNNRRQRISITNLDDLVATLAGRYGLCYQREDGSPGRPIDRAWFEVPRMEPLTRDFPGYLSPSGSGLLDEDIAA